MMSTQDVINSFYNSVRSKDDRWQQLWAEDAVFADAARILDARGKEAVIKSFTPFIQGVAGLKVKDMILEGEKACFIISYTYVNAKQENMNQDVAEVWEVRDGKLAKLTIYFDLTAYRHFMRG
jgi:ketosteroid isomerase-like protein